MFSSAKVLLTFMSQAKPSSGSQIFTMGTLAAEMQTTFSMPPKKRGVSKRSMWLYRPWQLTPRQQVCNFADSLQLSPRCGDADVNCLSVSRWDVDSRRLDRSWATTICDSRDAYHLNRLSRAGSQKIRKGAHVCHVQAIRR